MQNNNNYNNNNDSNNSNNDNNNNNIPYLQSFPFRFSRSVQYLANTELICINKANVTLYIYILLHHRQIE